MVGIGAKFKHTLACGVEPLGGCMWGLGAQNPEGVSLMSVSCLAQQALFKQKNLKKL